MFLFANTKLLSNNDIKVSMIIFLCLVSTKTYNFFFLINVLNKKQFSDVYSF